MEYMKANVTVNVFYAGSGAFIRSEKTAIAFRDMPHLERIVEVMKNHALAKGNLVLDILIDSIEPL